ncbi:MAG: acetylesterase [Clostridia bacterium]|nr:acetylesterase [Clostridia bacterium]
MAFIQMNIFSKTLMRTVPVNVILPVDKIGADNDEISDKKSYKILYLLHGILGNYMDWVTGTRIQRYAEEHDLVVVMPSGDNAAYIDQVASHNLYGEFIGKELVEMTRKMFPLSCKKEDTFIGGLSMGGYGAMRNGLKYHETFGAIISLSGVLNIDKFRERNNDTDNFIERRDFTEAVWGDLNKVAISDKNPKYLVEQMLKQGVRFPKIYLACGKDDFLLEANEEFRDYLKEKGIEVTYESGEGGHEWDFWDEYIEKAIQWLPIEKSGLGISSGNVGL